MSTVLPMLGSGPPRGAPPTRRVATVAFAVGGAPLVWSAAPSPHRALIIEICSIAVLLVAEASCLAGTAPSASTAVPPPGTQSIAA